MMNKEQQQASNDNDETAAPPTDVMTYDEAAAFLRCSVRTLERWVSDGRVPSFRGPGGRSFSRASLKKWVERQESADAARTRKLRAAA